MKNITLSIDEETLKVGREYAHRHHISFNLLVRQLIQKTVRSDSNQWLEDTFTLMDKLKISSKGRRWVREEIYRV